MICYLYALEMSASVWKFRLQYFFMQDSYELFSQHLAFVNLLIFPTSCLKA